MMRVSITYLVDEVERKFMELRIDLGNFSLQVGDSSRHVLTTFHSNMIKMLS